MKIARMFPALSGILSIICGVYCIFWWDAPDKLTFIQPDISIPCWLFCSTLNPVFALLNFVVSSFSIYAGASLFHRGDSKKMTSISFVTGILLFPVGILNFLSLMLREDKSDVNL